MKALHITATWVMLVKDPDPWPHDLEAVSDEIMGELYSSFDGQINSIRDVKVFVQHMPGEYTRQLDREEAKQQIENDTDQGISFLDTMAGSPKVRHPWDDGMWIFPEDHPLSAMEREAHRKGDKRAGDVLERAYQHADVRGLPRGNQ